MPTVRLAGPYRFYFVSHDLPERPHVHVDRDEMTAKFWLERSGSLEVSVSHHTNSIGSKAWSPNVEINSWRHGMTFSAPSSGERVKDVRFSDDSLSVDLFDGRTITAPLAWFPRLLHATPQQRVNWRLAGAGYGIHWPEVDEDISTEGLLRGAAAPGHRTSAA